MVSSYDEAKNAVTPFDLRGDMFPAILRPPAFRIVEGDEVDAGMTSVDFDGVPNRPFVNVGQRDPKLEMTLVEDGPILIGEWFVIAWFA